VDRQYEEDQQREDQALLKELEDELRDERDIKTKRSLRRDIQEVRDRIADRQTRLAAIAQPSPPQTLETLVAEARQRCCAKILHQHSTIRLLNNREIGVDQLYVDVWLLQRSPRTFQTSASAMLQTFDLRSDRRGMSDRIEWKDGMDIANHESRL
jgi:hypothetical protein